MKTRLLMHPHGLKKAFWLAITGLIFLSTTLMFTPQVKASETTIFSDGFESYDVSTFPWAGGWILEFDGYNPSEQKIVNTVSVSPTKSLQLLGWGISAVAIKSFTSTSNVIGYEAYVRTEDYAGASYTVAYIGFRSKRWDSVFSNWNYYVTFETDGRILYRGQNFLDSYSPNTWYKVRVVVDKTTNLCNVWINDALKGENLVEPSYFYERTYLALSAQWAHVKTYFDNVRVFSITNDPPVANANGPYSGDEGSLITLTGTDSYDPDGTIVGYEWDLDNDSIYETYGQNVQKTWMVNGYYTVWLKVVDNNGAEDISSVDVNVWDRAPTASFTWTPITPNEGTAVSFIDTSTSSPDTIVFWSWSFGDGGTSTLQNPIYIR